MFLLTQFDGFFQLGSINPGGIIIRLLRSTAAGRALNQCSCGRSFVVFWPARLLDRRTLLAVAEGFVLAVLSNRVRGRLNLLPTKFDGQVEGFVELTVTDSHKPMSSASNRKAIRHANDHSLTINLTADCPVMADKLAGLGIGPVVTVLPSPQRNQHENSRGSGSRLRIQWRSPSGRIISARRLRTAGSRNTRPTSKARYPMQCEGQQTLDRGKDLQ